MKRANRVPAWSLLVGHGFCDNRKTAESWILSGKVFANDQRVDVAGQLVADDSVIRVLGIDQRYVGRGGIKLEGALSDFNIDVSGRTALDTGASTGGFTDCLVQHGASKVYAIDVGYGQLAGSLRQNPLVINMERINIGEVAPAELVPKPNLATVDLSYLSLTEAIPIIAKLLDGNWDMVCLVKPLFEVNDSDVRRTGKISDPTMYVDLLFTLCSRVQHLGFVVRGISHSHVTGHAGTHEFFLWVSNTGKNLSELDRHIATTVQNVLQMNSKYAND